MFCTCAFLMRDLSQLAPKNKYSVTRGSLPEIVTENVAAANLELIVSNAIRRRMEEFGKSKNSAKGQSYMRLVTFNFLRKFLWAQGGIPAMSVTIRSHNQGRRP